MRKRIVIAALAIIVLGVLAYTLSQPKKGSVEWHKHRYLAAWKPLQGHTWTAQLKSVCYEIVGKPEPKLSPAERKRLNRVMESHWAALVNLGYISETRFVLTNCTFDTVRKLASPSEVYPIDEPFVKAWSIERDTKEEIVLKAPREVIARWSNIVQTVDAPKG